MKSSKIENLYDFNPTLEDTKSLSPLTYYQPFQSTFDPEFSSPPTATHHRQDSPEFPMDAWCQSVVDAQSSSRDVIDRSHLRPWTEYQSESRSGFNSDRHVRPADLKTSASLWTPDGGVTRRTATLASSPNLFSNPRHSLLSYGDDHRMSGDGMFSLFSSNGGHGSVFDSRCLGGSRGAANSFGSSSMRSDIVTGGEGLSRRSIYHHQLMLDPFAKNISSNFYKSGHNRPMMCNFCKNNKEVPDIYLNHFLYDPETKVLTCPVLRKHVCEICGETGDRAHTLQYCPVNRERGLQAKVPVLLKTRTITNSTGKIRRN